MLKTDIKQLYLAVLQKETTLIENSANIQNELLTTKE